MPTSLDNYLFAFSPWILSRSQTSRSERGQLVLLQTCSQFNRDSIPESAMQGQAQISQVLLCPHPGSQPIIKTQGFCARCAAEPPLPFALPVTIIPAHVLTAPPNTCNNFLVCFPASTSPSYHGAPKEQPLRIFGASKSALDTTDTRVASTCSEKKTKDMENYLCMCINNWTTVLYSRH